MPYVQPSWRQWPQLMWLSRLLCRLGRHHWVRSTTLGHLPIACWVCPKKTRHYEAYAALARGDRRPHA